MGMRGFNKLGVLVGSFQAEDDNISGSMGSGFKVYVGTPSVCRTMWGFKTGSPGDPLKG